MRIKLIKVVSLLLAITLLTIAASSVVSAAASDSVSLENSGITDDGKLMIDIVCENDKCFSVEGYLDVNVGGFTLDSVTFYGNDNDQTRVNTNTGKIIWVDMYFDSEITKGDVIATATYTVADGIADGDYELDFYLEVFTGASGDPEKPKDTFTTTVTVNSPVTNVSVTAVGSSLGHAYTVDGQVVTVIFDKACKVGYWDAANSKYVAIAATKVSNNTYTFTAPNDVTEVLLVVKGDANLDGKILAGDVSRINAAVLKKTTLTAQAEFAAEVTGDGKILAGDGARINASILGKTILAW